MTEEERAAQFRVDSAARLQATRARAALLKGSETARAALTAAWLPVAEWIAERQAPAFPTPEEVQQEATLGYHGRAASLPGLAGPGLDRRPAIRDPDEEMSRWP